MPRTSLSSLDVGNICLASSIQKKLSLRQMKTGYIAKQVGLCDRVMHNKLRDRDLRTINLEQLIKIFDLLKFTDEEILETFGRVKRNE